MRNLLPITPLPSTVTPQMRRAAQAFEAQAFSQLMAPAFTAPGGPKARFGGGAAEDQWRPMLLDAMAQSASRAGGVGIRDMVLRDMLRAQEAAQRETAT